MANRSNNKRHGVSTAEHLACSASATSKVGNLREALAIVLALCLLGCALISLSLPSEWEIDLCAEGRYDHRYREDCRGCLLTGEEFAECAERVRVRYEDENEYAPEYVP